MAVNQDPPDYRPDQLPSVARLLSLSDGVVAIALTLLVLQLRVPTMSQVGDANSASDLAAQLAGGLDHLVSYLISFYVIAQFWLAHHRVFRQIAGHHEGVAWWNFAFLFTITVMPFTSDLLGQYGENPLAVDIFAFNLLLASLATQSVLLLGRHRHLLVRVVDARSLTTSKLRTIFIVFVLSVSMGLAWVNPGGAKFCWILIAFAPVLANRWYDSRHPPVLEPPATPLP